ncbi:ABC transporter ATP-binding protein/permease [Pelagibacteraceae bacterium]|nr:ABC transporter ATP-binding protein/permease [Pelagibacteraceae bacterium]
MTGSQILARLFRDSIRPYAARLASSLFFMIIIALSTGATAWLLDPAIDKIFLDKDESMLLLIPIAIILTLLIKSVATYIQIVLLNGVAQNIIADTQIKLFKKIINADLSWLHKIHSAKIISNFLYDVTLLQDSVSSSLANGVKDLLTLICLLGVMYYQDWQLATISIIAFPLVGLLTKRLGKRVKKASTETQEETGVLASILSENLDGTRIVKAYQQEEQEIEKLSNSVWRRVKKILKGANARGAASPFAEFLAGFGIAGTLYYAGLRGLQGELPLNEFVSFLGAMMLAFQPLRRLASINTTLQEGFAAAIRVFGLLDQKSLINEKKDARDLSLSKSNIDLQEVTLSYEGQTNSALKEVSLNIPHGKTTALVGPSGSGKSSILNLIPRFYDPDSGKLKIDGQNIKDLTISSVRSVIALVSQEPILFDMTIKENILYSRPNSTDEEIISAAKSAAADSFISELPNGYDTIIGEKGYSLSGGQKQRISIARAFLKNAPILLLDEATSSLDTESESLVQEAIKKLMKDRTTLVIAHRLSTIINADQIIVLNDGKIVESGNHEELLLKNGIYKKLYEREF